MIQANCAPQSLRLLLRCYHVKARIGHYSFSVSTQSIKVSLIENNVLQISVAGTQLRDLDDAHFIFNVAAAACTTTYLSMV